MSLEREFLDHLPVIDQVVQFIGRRHRLDPGAIEELQSAIHLKIIDNDYEVLRKFEGRSSMRTYLTAVVQRHFLDSRTALWGRWRPCACARRAGPSGEPDKGKGRRQKAEGKELFLPFAFCLLP